LTKTPCREKIDVKISSTKGLPMTSVKILKPVLWAGLMLIYLLTVTVTGFCANTFQEPKGRFDIDLPNGWALTPQTNPTVYVFKGTQNSNTIIIEYAEGKKSVAATFNAGMNTLKAAGLPNPVEVEKAKDFKVNGNPARWGVYSDEVTYGSVKVLLYGLLGAVTLDKGRVYFLSIISKDDKAKFQKTYQTAFESIRSKGQEFSGVSYEPIAKPNEPALTSTTFTHPSITLTLPPGWAPHDIPSNFEKETVAWLKSDTIAGASITVFCYRGPMQSYRSTRIRGLKTIAASYPIGQSEMKKTTKLVTDSGFSATTELWKGFVSSGGQMLTLQSPLGIVKSEKGWIMMIGYVPDAGGPQLEEDFLMILKSTR
jgi:hypothetical protein